MFDEVLLKNYGHAGAIYAEHLVKNVKRIGEEYARLRDHIGAQLAIQQNERYWGAALAANILGGLMSKKLGIHDWDINRIWLWASEMLVSLRSEIVTAPYIDPLEILGSYLNRFFKHTLIINGPEEGRTPQEFPTKEPFGELLIRIEPNTNRMYLSTKHFQNECVELQVNYRETLKELKQLGYYIGGETKRLGTGVRG